MQFNPHQRHYEASATMAASIILVLACSSLVSRALKELVAELGRQTRESRASHGAPRHQLWKLERLALPFFLTEGEPCDVIG
jgi:hypothetical protein